MRHIELAYLRAAICLSARSGVLSINRRASLEHFEKIVYIEQIKGFSGMDDKENALYHIGK